MGHKDFDYQTGLGCSATIMACIACESMALITDADDAAINDSQNYLSNATVVFSPTICKQCEAEEAAVLGATLPLPHRNTAISFDIILMWQPYTAADAYTEGQLRLDKERIKGKEVCRLVDRKQMLGAEVNGKVFRTMTIVSTAEGALNVQPYLSGDFF